MKKPGFTVIAVLTLALGIGVNLALFTLLDAQFLRPRPVARPEELWRICPSDASGGPRFFHFSRPYYDAIRKYNRAFKDLVSLVGVDTKLRLADGRQDIVGQMVSANYFDFVGLRPVLGRGLLPEDEKPGARLVVVIGYRLWQRNFGGNPAIAGKTIELHGRLFEVVGVAPPGFVGLGTHPPDFLLPFSAEQLFFLSPTYTVFGRLEKGSDPRAAADSLAPIVQEITKLLNPANGALGLPPDDAGNNSEFTRVALLRAGYGSADPEFARSLRGSLLKANSLAGMGALMVLLIAASNLTSLLLARGLERRKEMATRMALGATRLALVRQLTLEGVLLAALGTVGALIALNWFGAAVPAMLPAVVFNGAAPDNLHPDVRVAANSVATAFLVGIGFSLPPALYATRFDPFAALREASGVAAGCERRGPLRRLLVIGQVAGSLVLLSGVFLCLHAIDQRLHVDIGFRPERLLVANADLENAGYAIDSAPGRCEALRSQLSLLPGVEAVGTLDHRPFTEMNGLVTDRLDGHEGSEITIGGFVQVGPECFRALGIPLLEGREVTAGDFAVGRHVALVSQSFVREFWPGRPVLGRAIEFLGDKYEVIGIVRDARMESPGAAPKSTVFFAMCNYSSLHPVFIIRSKANPGTLVKPVLAELTKVHPRLRESGVYTMREAMRGSFAAQRRVMGLLGELGGLALGLTALGVYGLMSFLVTQRTREIGLRLAVGARRRDVARLILRFGIGLALAGVGLGLPTAFCGSILLRHVVFGVNPFDLPGFVFAAAAVIATVCFACLLPAMRAMRVDPMVALRYE